MLAHQGGTSLGVFAIASLDQPYDILVVILHLMGHCYYSWAQSRKTVHCHFYPNLSCTTLALAKVLLHLACHLETSWAILAQPWVILAPDIHTQLGPRHSCTYWPQRFKHMLATDILMLGSDIHSHAVLRHLLS